MNSTYYIVGDALSELTSNECGFLVPPLLRLYYEKTAHDVTRPGDPNEAVPPARNEGPNEIRCHSSCTSTSNGSARPVC